MVTLVCCGALSQHRASSIDLSGLEAFWRLVDQLQSTEGATDEHWEAVFATPGYAVLAQRQNADRLLRATLPPALGLAQGEARREVYGMYVAHLRRAVERRAALDAFARTLAESDLGPRAWDLAATWLPAEAL
ncbi:MAG: hypothetical protein ACYTGC_01480, partial [Planctomycetota bacterium]